MNSTLVFHKSLDNGFTLLHSWLKPFKQVDMFTVHNRSAHIKSMWCLRPSHISAISRPSRVHSLNFGSQQAPSNQSPADAPTDIPGLTCRPPDPRKEVWIPHIYIMLIKHDKAIINHPYFDGLYHPFVVKYGMVYYCFTKIAGISQYFLLAGLAKNDSQ